VRIAARVLCVVAPFAVVKIYRLVPAAVRGHYPGCPVSTSHLFAYGDGWGVLFRLVGDTKPPRPKMP
jgi:hypothetical protein